MKKLHTFIITALVFSSITVFGMKRLPEGTLEQGHEKKVKIQPAMVYPLSNGQFIKLNRDAVLLCDQLVDLLHYSQEDYNAIFPGINVNQIPFNLDLTDDEVTILFNILNTITQSARSFTDPKTQKCYYLNQDVFETTFNMCKEKNALNTHILIKMISACDFLMCDTLLNTLTRIFVDKSKELTVNHDYNFAEFPENTVRFLKKHLHRKTLGVRLNTYIPECNVIDYIILNNGLLPIHNNQIDLSGTTNKAKLTTLDGLEIIVNNTDALLITVINLGSNYLTLTSNFTTLQNFPNLLTLILANNQLIQLPENIFSKCSQLQMLDLRNNNLIQLPENIFYSLTQLQGLYLSYNQLTALPKGIFNDLAMLRELNLCHNKLIQLPENIFNVLTHLQDLRIDHNQLTHLSENIFNNLHQLQLLHLDNNKLKSLPENIFNSLAQLQELDLSKNLFSSLPEKIVQLLYWLNQEQE